MELVKIITDDSGDPRDPDWHLVVDYCGSPQTFCSGEVFGEGEGSATFETKRRKRGGITCDLCLARIAEIKAVRL